MGGTEGGADAEGTLTLPDMMISRRTADRSIPAWNKGSTDCGGRRMRIEVRGEIKEERRAVQGRVKVEKKHIE